MKDDVISCLLEQAKLLKEKTKSLQDVCKTLDEAIGFMRPSGSVHFDLPWEIILKTMEVIT